MMPQPPATLLATPTLLSPARPHVWQQRLRQNRPRRRQDYHRHHLRWRQPLGLETLPGDKLVVFATKLADGADRTDADYAVVGLTSSGQWTQPSAAAARSSSM
jgi:hypothetical protein